MTPRDRRALLFGVGAVALGVLGLRVMPWAWRTMHTASVRQHAEREYVLRGREEVARFGALEDSVRVLVGQVAELAPRLLSGNAMSEATAAFAGELNYLALQHRARLERTDAVADSTRAGELKRVTLDAVLESDVRGLAGLLGAVASRVPVMEVIRLRVTAQDPSVAGAGPEVLRIELRLRAWFLSREAA